MRAGRQRRRGPAGAAMLLSLAPLTAAAHGDLDRLGPFYAGAAHPLLVTGHALALLGLGLLVGQRGLSNEGRSLSALALGLLAGLALGQAVAPGVPIETAVLVLGAVAALATVAGRGLPRPLMPALAAAIGLGIGLDSLPDAGTAWMRWSGMAGTGLGALAATALAAALADQARAAWSRIGLRVMASWLAASALLVLALGAIDRPSASASGAVRGDPAQVIGSAGASKVTTRPQDQ